MIDPTQQYPLPVAPIIPSAKLIRAKDGRGAVETKDILAEALADLFWNDPAIDKARIHACLVRHYEKELARVYV